MSLSDYSSMEEEIKNAPEPKILPAGSEVKARIIIVNTGISNKNDARWYSVVFDVPSETLCPSFSDFFWDLLDRDKIIGADPTNGPKQVEGAKRQYRDFGQAFNVDWSRPVNWEDNLPGLTGWMILGVKKDKSGEYPDQNKVNKYISPKMTEQTCTVEDEFAETTLDDDIPF
jgi:hypothetical protein